MKPLLLLLSAGPLLAAGLPVAPLERSTPVDFEREIVPILRDNCLSCHCQTTTKGGLKLESPGQILKGGDTGPGAIAGKGAESLVWRAAAHLDDDLKMPPRDNKAKAKDLLPEQLALFKLWIDQGAKASAKVARVINWQPVAASLQAIRAAAVTPDGQFAACARANRIALYHLPSGRLVATEVAHRDQVNALAFSPDGTALASGGYREVKIWRRPSNVQRLTLADAGTRIAASGDGKWFATGGDDGIVKLWDSASGKPGAVIAAAKAPVTSLAFSPDNSKLLCTAADKSITTWNVADGKAGARVEAPAVAQCGAWLGAQVLTGGADGVVRIWSDALAPVKELTGHKGAVNALAVQDGLIVSGGADGTARIWNLEKGKETVTMNHGGPVNAVAIRADGKRIASAGENKLAKLWDGDGKAVAELRGIRRAQEAAGQRERELQLAGAGVSFQKTAVGNAEKAVKTAEDSTKKVIAAIDTRQKELEAKQKSLTDARDAKAAADKALTAAETEVQKAGEAFAVAEKAAQEAKAALESAKAKTPPEPQAVEQAKADAGMKSQELAKAKSAQEKLTSERKKAAEKIEPAAKKLAEAEDAARRAEVSRKAADTEVVLVKADEQKAAAAVTEAKTASEAAEAVRKQAEQDSKTSRTAVDEAAKPLRAVAFSPDGISVVAAGEDAAVHTWTAASGAASDILTGHKAPVTALTFLPGGELISAAQDRTVVVWNPNPAWKLDRTIGSGDGTSPFADRVCALAFSADGKTLATGGGEPSRGGELKLWKVDSGEFLRAMPDIHSDTIFGLDFSPDGKFLASAAADKTARVTEIATGKLVRNFEGHAHHVLSVSWSPDGRTLATAGADAQVKLWDTATGDRKKNIAGYDKEVTAVRYLAAGDKLVTASGDSKVRLLSAAGEQVRVFGDTVDFVDAVASTADGRIIIAGGQQSTLHVWNSADGKVLAAFPPPKN